MEPLKIAQTVDQRYRQYLRTTFHFRDPELRRSFELALASGHLSRGPFLEATPTFTRGCTAREVAEDVLSPARPDGGLLLALQADRLLYVHQEESIKKVFKGRNVIVATGTGSGKTEAFLYPILLDLYREFRAGSLSPGVRALILYPMNALANDQRERLGDICASLEKSASEFRFTFGQYTGETPEDEGDTQRNAAEHIASRLPGELVLRSEMRARPPHVLLTNYSMLEYLLLRPADSELFDGGRAKKWKYLVVDEAHQYRGSKGTELAMLIRRLKQRLKRGGNSDGFRCIATSASLVGGEGDTIRVAQFARDLFGEEFESADLILGAQEKIPEPSDASLVIEEYAYLLGLLNGTEAESNRLSDLLRRVGCDADPGGDKPGSIAALLERDRRACSLRRLVTGNAVDIREVGDQLFAELPDPERVPALGVLVSLLMTLRSPGSQAPLLSARYHLFLRSLEGAFASFFPEKSVILDRKDTVDKRKYFEVALCRECGQHYLIGHVQNGFLVEAMRDPGQSSFGVEYYRPIEGPVEELEDAEIPAKEVKSGLILCTQCGRLGVGPPQCGHTATLPVVKEANPANEGKADQIVRCGACGYSAAGRDPVREVFHGTDGPHAVIATTLHEVLAEGRKKILAFADGRQDAAYFAWYLETSYKEILGRNLILRALRRNSPSGPDNLTLEDLAVQLRKVLREYNIGSPNSGEITIRNDVWRRIYREFLTTEPRLSLEGVGLVRWFLKWPDHVHVPDLFMHEPWHLTAAEAKDLMSILLDTMRKDRGVELLTEDGLTFDWRDLGLEASQLVFKIGPPGGRPGLRSWDGKTSKRVSYLVKLLTQRGLPAEMAREAALEALRTMWDVIRDSDRKISSSDDRLLLPVGDGCRINPRWYRSVWVGEGTVKRCTTCGQIQHGPFNQCARASCRGTLELIRPESLDRDHYRSLYLAMLPSAMRVEEHTAQLDNEKAREFQRDFRDGRIHVLSCSTTFELGVDLGDLNTVFLRNVPPESFNYAQRVGRAGRRIGSPGFATTYCKRGPHDLYHFAAPERMISGRTQPPTIGLSNEKIVTRHLVAVALSAYFRSATEKFKSVEALLGDIVNPRASHEITHFLTIHREFIEKDLQDVIPEQIWRIVQESWIQRVAGSYVDCDGQPTDSRFQLAEQEVSSDLTAVMALEEEARRARDYSSAEWAKRRADTIRNENVLSFLSRKAVLPKYGFPVDVVELDTQRVFRNRESAAVQLQRDLSIAISEFAPSSQIIANKRLWTSYGLKRVAGKEWPRMRYKRCQEHNVFVQWKEGSPEPTSPCGHPLPKGVYVVPQFGFLTERDKSDAPTGRPARVFSTRPYFSHNLAQSPDSHTIGKHEGLLRVSKASPGMMVVLCEGSRGKGFYVCSACGAGFTSRPKSHRNPVGATCTGCLENVALGHEFVTDVLRLQFIPPPPTGPNPLAFAYSLSHALVEGVAEVLDVPVNDLNATVAQARERVIPEIVVYDNVPGGAGLVSRLHDEHVLQESLTMSLKRVNGKCGCETSCYGCLRAYRNQFAHHLLNRVPVKEYLSDLLSRWK